MVLGSGIQVAKFAKGLKDLSSDSPQTKAQAKKYLEQLAQKEGGLYTKIIQYMGAHKKEELSSWQSELKPIFEADEILPYITQTLGMRVDLFIKNITNEHYLASIGQVTKGFDQEGNAWALKLQYPHVAKAIQNQLRIARFAPMVGKIGKVKNMELQSYYDMLDRILHKELDYLHEINQQVFFRELFHKTPEVYVPEVYPGFRSSKFYIQEFIEGDDFQTVLNTYNQSEKDCVAKALALSFVLPFLTESKIHTDTNPSNFIFFKDHIALIDFGQVSHFRPEVSREFKKIIHLLQASSSPSENEILESLSLIGFKRAELEMFKNKLIDLSKILLAPFISKEPFDLKSWQYKNELRNLLGDDIWTFRQAGTTDFFELMKAFSGLKVMIEKLHTKIDWNHMILSLSDRN